MFFPSFFRDVNGGRGGSNVNASVDTLRVAEARVKAVIAERFEEAVAGIQNDRLPIPVFFSHEVLYHRWTRSTKILEGCVVSFPEGGGCKFFESEGGYPPLTPKKFSPAAVTIFYSTFFS